MNRDCTEETEYRRQLARSDVSRTDLKNELSLHSCRAGQLLTAFLITTGLREKRFRGHTSSATFSVCRLLNTKSLD
jgi:hypothetical protein